MLLFPSRLCFPVQLPVPSHVTQKAAALPRHSTVGMWPGHTAMRWGPSDPIWVLCDGGGWGADSGCWFSPKLKGQFHHKDVRTHNCPLRDAPPGWRKPQTAAWAHLRCSPGAHPYSEVGVRSSSLEPLPRCISKDFAAERKSRCRGANTEGSGGGSRFPVLF